MTSLYLIAVFALLIAWQKTRKFALYFLPWLIFAVTYDSMRFYPNYMVGSIDVRELYEAEKSLFGIAAQTPTEFQAIADHSQMMIPGEYFSVHHAALPDLMAGFFYLCWVPVPVGFALCPTAKHLLGLSHLQRGSTDSNCCRWPTTAGAVCCSCRVVRV